MERSPNSPAKPATSSLHNARQEQYKRTHRKADSIPVLKIHDDDHHVSVRSALPSTSSLLPKKQLSAAASLQPPLTDRRNSDKRRPSALSSRSSMSATSVNSVEEKIDQFKRFDSGTDLLSPDEIEPQLESFKKSLAGLREMQKAAKKMLEEKKDADSSKAMAREIQKLKEVDENFAVIDDLENRIKLASRKVQDYRKRVSELAKKVEEREKDQLQLRSNRRWGTFSVLFIVLVVILAIKMKIHMIGGGGDEWEQQENLKDFQDLQTDLSPEPEGNVVDNPAVPFFLERPKYTTFSHSLKSSIETQWQDTNSAFDDLYSQL